jgi:hypothetical protein
MEPRYVEDPFDEDGPAFGVSRPKWMVPQSEFEKKVLSTLGMHYYPRKLVGDRATNSREMRSKLIEIGKSLVSLESGLDAVYPTEWVMSVLQWYKDHGRIGWTALKAFLNSLHDIQWRDEFIAQWRKNHPNYYGLPKEDPAEFEKYFRLPGE